MRRKLHRSRRSVFSQRRVHPIFKVLGTLVICVAVVAAGFFSAKFLSERGEDQSVSPTIGSDDNNGGNKPHTGNSGSSNKPGNNSGSENGDSSNTTPSTPTSLDTVRAFYLPHSALLADDLSSTLTAARKAGFNAVVFDLKDADGKLYYRFTNAQAKKVNSYADNAFTADSLKALFDQIRQQGLNPIPRLYAFRDDAACAVMTDARVAYIENHTWAWYDGDKAQGAKKWLNPYSDTAQSYIQGLATELKGAGASAIMLEGVQFPDKLDKSAYLGEKSATVGKDAILTEFIAATRTALGADCPLLLSCTSAASLGTETKIYGGNPLTFGATVASPLLSSKVKESVEKMILRTQVLEQKTALAPMLAADGLSAAKVNDTIAATVAGGTNSFILYATDGKYDFAAYTLP